MKVAEISIVKHLEPVSDRGSLFGREAYALSENGVTFRFQRMREAPSYTRRMFILLRLCLYLSAWTPYLQAILQMRSM